MDAKLKDMAEYIVIAIHEFAKRHQLEEEQAYRYLNHYKAIDFLETSTTWHTHKASMTSSKA